MEKFNAIRLNKILGREIFNQRKTYAYKDEVKRKTGLTIKQLLYAFIFSSRNNFYKELQRWKETNKPMRWQKINAIN